MLSLPPPQKKEGKKKDSPQMLFRNPVLQQKFPLPKPFFLLFFFFFFGLIFGGGCVKGVDLFLLMTPFPTLTFLQPT